MAVLEWDQVGSRIFQAGLDRGVLYLPDGSGVPWNGLVSVTESEDREAKSFYMDGIKYLEQHVPGDFAAELRAITYPDEFDELNGIVLDDGVYFHNQLPQPFGLSYRTRVGNDLDGLDHGYKIHILYNVLAIPSSIGYETLSNTITPITFGWTLSAVPVSYPGHKPTAHISIDSTKIEPEVLAVFEKTLYGSADSDASLPPMDVLLGEEDLSVVDNGDGTFTVTLDDELLEVVDDEFTIHGADAEMLDEDTYEISSG